MPKRSRNGQTNALPASKKQKANPQPGRPQQRNAGSGSVAASSFAAAAYATGQRSREPNVSASGRSTRIRHRELVSTVTGSVAFSVFGSYDLNPGVAATFPWLSTQASGWEQYRFHKLCFELFTRAPTTSTGSVILAPDYDSLDAPPASEAVATSYRDSTEDAPWKDQVCHLDPTAMHPIGPRKYVRSALVANSDLKTYDAGTMHVCTVSQANTDGIAKLWVEYDVEFFVPQTASSGAAAQNNSFALFNLSANQSLTTATAATIVFDETVVNDLGIVNSSGVLTLPKGNWEVRAEACCSGGTSTVASLLLAIEKNGAALAVPCESNFAVNTSGTTLFNPMVSATAYVPSTGSDTVRVRVTYTSVAGTLVAAGDRCRLMVRIC